MAKCSINNGSVTSDPSVSGVCTHILVLLSASAGVEGVYSGVTGTVLHGTS